MTICAPIIDPRYSTITIQGAYCADLLPTMKPVSNQVQSPSAEFLQKNYFEGQGNVNYLVFED
jgi:hypothetical protein